MNIFSDLEEEEGMLKYQKIKAYAFVEALLALMIATLTVLLLSFILGDSLKREKTNACILNEYSSQLMKLHEGRPPIYDAELIKPATTDKETMEKKSTAKEKKSSQTNKDKNEIQYYKATSKTAPTSISIHCNQEEVIQIEGMGPTSKVSLSSD